MSEVLTPVKGISMTALIVGIEVGHTGKFPVDQFSTIRPLISGRIADKYPDRKYSTDTVTEPGFLIVKRIK